MEPVWPFSFSAMLLCFSDCQKRFVLCDSWRCNFLSPCQAVLPLMAMRWQHKPKLVMLFTPPFILIHFTLAKSSHCNWKNQHYNNPSVKGCSITLTQRIHLKTKTYKTYLETCFYLKTACHLFLISVF